MNSLDKNGAPVEPTSEYERMGKAQFKSYIADLEQNVRINKELLQNVLMATSPSQGHQDLIAKLQKEIDRLGKLLKDSHKSKCELIQGMQDNQKSKDELAALLKDKEQKFEVYLSKCRQDLDERNRTIDNQTRALERLRPIVERFEKEMEQRDGKSSTIQESEVSHQPKQSDGKSEASMETVEVDEIVNENEKLTKELEKANKEINRLRDSI
jgi:chromosome segregation ATPase